MQKYKKIFVPIDNPKIRRHIEIEKFAELFQDQSLSNSYISITTLLQFALKKIEQLKIFPDLIVVATENFPFRSNKIFQKIIDKIIKYNYDIVICDKNEKGSIILKNEKQRNVIVDGIIPKSVIKSQYSTTRIGFGCVLRPSNIRSGNLLDGKIGSLTINDHREYLEVNKTNINKIKKLLI